jgi:hypothetical protein
VPIATALKTHTKRGALNPGLDLKHSEKSFLLPLLAPLGTVFDPPINPRQFKSDVVPSFLRLVPLVPQNLLVLGSEFLAQQRFLHQIVCRARPFRFARYDPRGIHARSFIEQIGCQVKLEKHRFLNQDCPLLQCRLISRSWRRTCPSLSI